MENKINLSNLSSQMSQSSGKSKKLCEDFLREFFRLISESLQEGESIKIKGFGTFKLSEVESRTGINVNTGKPQEIASHKKISFTPAKELAALINAPFEEFESVEMADEIPEELLENKDEIEPQQLMEEKNKKAEEEKLSDENLVSNLRLEEGSDEEGEDDEITLEAYQDKEEEKESSEEHYIIEEGDDKIEEEESEAILAASKTNGFQEKIIEERVKLPEEPNEEKVGVSPHISEDYLPKEKSRFGLGFLTGGLSVFVVCAVIFMLGCFFDWWPVNFGDGKAEIDEPIATIVTPEEETEESQKEDKEEKEPVYDTVSTTRYLTTISREHYGNYNFWPYIYLENESILGHPDRITPGTKVIVPELSKYGVDPNNKEDVAEAKKKALEIYSRFN